MNARSLMRRRRRRLHIGAALALGLMVGVTSWVNLAPPEYRPAAIYSAVAFQSASYGVKSDKVFSDSSRSSDISIAVTPPFAPSAIPEPASLFLMAPALLLLHRRRRAGA